MGGGGGSGGLNVSGGCDDFRWIERHLSPSVSVDQVAAAASPVPRKQYVTGDVTTRGTTSNGVTAQSIGGGGGSGGINISGGLNVSAGGAGNVAVGIGGGGGTGGRALTASDRQG